MAAAYASIKGHKHAQRHSKTQGIFYSITRLSESEWCGIVFLQLHKQVAPDNLLLGLIWSLRVILLRLSVGCFVLEDWRGPVNATQGFKLSLIIY